MAAPQVAGAAALISSIADKEPGTANPARLRSALLKGADHLGNPGTDNIYSQGRRNVLRAVTKQQFFRRRSGCPRSAELYSRQVNLHNMYRHQAPRFVLPPLGSKRKWLQRRGDA